MPRILSCIYQVLNISFRMSGNLLSCVSGAHGCPSLGSVRIPGDLIPIGLSGGILGLKTKKYKSWARCGIERDGVEASGWSPELGPRVDHL